MKTLTGIKPTGKLHMGNYFGAIKPLLEMDGDVYLFIADLHSLTVEHETLGKDVEHIAKALIAFSGKKKITIYKQSDFPQLTELFWILTNLTTIPQLELGHAFKDSDKKNIGILLYPVLMASDILLPDADIVPVGKDQEQHLEMSRELARKFNNRYGKFFKEPKAKLVVESESIIGTDGENKMSKSLNNTIPIFSDEEEIRKSIMSIKTDSTAQGSPCDPNNTVNELLKLVSSEEEMKEVQNKCKEGSITYKELKELLFERFIKYFSPAREKYNSLSASDVDKVLSSSYKEINKLFEDRLNEIRSLVNKS